MHNEVLHFTNIIRMMNSREMRWVIQIAACIGEMRNVYEILVEKPEGNMLLRKSKLRDEDINIMYLK
jgi:hypothetical protein